jgi:hypothetical protein
MRRDNVAVRSEVQRRLARCERAYSAERHRQQELIGEIRADGCGVR